MFPIALEGSREVLPLNTTECIILLTLWFILSRLGHGDTRPSHNISFLLLKNIHAMVLYVSEVLRPSAVSTHTTCVPCPSPTEPCSGPPLPTELDRGTERSH